MIDTTAAAAETTTTTESQSSEPAKLFWESFGDEGLKASPAVVKYKSVEDLARGLVAAESRLGVPADQLIRLPTNPDDPAAFDEIYGKLGRPEAAKDYQLEFPADAPEHVKALGGKLAEAAHKAGLAPRQLAPIVELLNAETAAAAQAEADAAKQAAETCGETLKQEWGGKYPVYQREIGNMVLELVGQDGLAELNEAGFGNNLTLMRMLAKMADLRAEPGKPPGEGGRADTPRGMTPAEARAARAVLEGDPVKGKALFDQTHPMHAEVVRQRTELLKAEAAKAEA